MAKKTIGQRILTKKKAFDVSDGTHTLMFGPLVQSKRTCKADLDGGKIKVRTTELEIAANGAGIVGITGIAGSIMTDGDSKASGMALDLVHGKLPRFKMAKK